MFGAVGSLSSTFRRVLLAAAFALALLFGLAVQAGAQTESEGQTESEIIQNSPEILRSTVLVFDGIDIPGTDVTSAQSLGDLAARPHVHLVPFSVVQVRTLQPPQ